MYNDVTGSFSDWCSTQGRSVLVRSV